MARRIHLRTDLSVDELERRYRAAKEPHERSWWQILWLLARGQLAKDIAESTGYSRYWIGQIAKRYNAEGPEGMRNRQYTHSHRASAALVRRAAGRAGAGGARAGAGGRRLAGAHGGGVDEPEARPPGQRAGGLGLPGAPRGQAAQAAPAPCAGRSRRSRRRSKKASDRSSARSRPPSPRRSVELWAVDEHRIGLKPILHKVWCFDGQAPDSRRCSTATSGAISSALSIPPQAARSFIWPPR